MRVIAAALLLIAAGAAAQNFPNRPQRMIVPQPPGGGAVIGTDLVAKADADGYTLLLGASTNLALNPGLHRNLPYDPKADFVPIGLAAAFAYILVARNDLPLNSLKEVVDDARANPGRLTYASAGNGSGQHISAALIWHLAGVSLIHIPYKGAQAVYQDLIPGRVDLFFDASSTARGQIEAARVKPLAVTGPVRLAYHPDVPTVRETGVLDFEMESWAGYFVRAGTPQPVLARLRADFQRVMATPEIAAAFEKRGARPLRLSVPETEALVAREIDKWTQLIRNAAISAD